MPTILELFQNKDFQSKGLTPTESPNVEVSSPDTSTLKELYENKESYVFGTDYSSVKTKKPPKNSTFNTVANFAEQEATGLRIKSAVELNNPLLYGNEAGRITLRSTAISDEMKQAANGSSGDGGLIGKGLDKLTGGSVTSLQGLRTKANTFLQDKLGIPVTPIPTRILGKITGDDKHTSTIEITSEWFGGQGTEFGKLLKSAGGSPKTILKQGAGKALGFAKDKLRDKLFGGATSVGEAEAKEPQVNYTTYGDGTTYSEQKEELLGDINKQDLEITKLDLSKVSPIYGVKRKEGYFGKEPGENGRTTPKGFLDKNEGKYIQKNTPEDGENYSNKYKNIDGSTLTLEERGLTRGGDTIAMGDPYTTTVNTENGEVTVEGFSPVKDLIPLFIGRYKSKTYPMMAFRCAITGLTETSSPSWASNNFVGNPYKYYIFETVERSVSFNLQVYAQNPLELANNWSKLSNLTKLSYPLIENNMAHPNFTQFTLGDMYRDKVCIVESLSYTFPDNGTWETDVEGLLLPKFIDVALTLKFVENVEDGSIRGIYSYPKNLSNASEVSSQHQIYATPNVIEYYVSDENGELKKKNKNSYINAGSGVKKTIKIKV